STVQAFNSAGTLLKSVVSNSAAGGLYTIVGLPAGTVFTRTFASSAYADKVYNNLPCEPSCTVSTGTAIVLSTAEIRSNLNFSLAASGSITGTVTDANTLTGLSGVTVQLYAGAGSPLALGSLVTSVTTNGSGTYTFTGLGPATYYARTLVTTTQNYLDEAYND